MSKNLDKQAVSCETTNSAKCTESAPGDGASEETVHAIAQGSAGPDATAVGDCTAGPSTGKVEQSSEERARPRPDADKIDPIPQSYGPLRHASGVFNRKLFGGALPPCLITLQRRKRALGYFAGRRFKSADGVHVTDEIALNPTHFARRGAKEVLSTLAHEQAHQWQAHFGKPSRSGYHNTEWAVKMREIGLIPSDTGRPGGKMTGERMSHYIEPGGLFDRAADQLIAKGFVLAFVERESNAAGGITLKKRLSKTRYSCPVCGLNAWAKPNVGLMCVACKVGLA